CWDAQIWELPGKADSQVQFPNLGQGHGVHRSMAIGHPVNCAVVHQDKVAVRGGADVQLDEIHSGVDGCLYRREGVLGVMKVFAAMSAREDFPGSATLPAIAYECTGKEQNRC